MKMEEEDDSRPMAKGAVDNDEGEEEEGQDEYEKDGFIADDIEEEEEEEEKKKKKRRESERFILDEDDYELLQDNTGLRRPKPNNKFKRSKKAGGDAEGEPSGFSDEEEFDRNSKGGLTAEEKLKHSLFGDDESVPLEDIAEGDHQDEDNEGDALEDEMADFIVEADDDDIDEELLVKHIQSRVREEGREHNIRDEFEPSIISEKYLTEKDDIIRETDIPERIQMLEEITGPPPTDDESIAEETTWIYNLLTSDVTCSLFSDNKLVKEVREKDIREVLTMMHVQKFDIPFIAMYRKELCASLLKDSDIDTHEDEEKTPKIRWHKVNSQEDEEKTLKIRWHKLLWAVQNLDKKWLLLQKRKCALHSYYNKCFEEEARRIDDEMILALNRRLFTKVIGYLRNAKSEREVDDVDAKFNLHFPPGEVEADEAQLKRLKQRSLYSICYKAGLWDFANNLSVNSERFGLLLECETLRRGDDIVDAKETPEEIASNFTCQMFETPEDVLKGARHMAAVEISCEPIVKQHVRTVFMEEAVVSTSPTPEGNLIIDVYHHLSGMKWLCNKPISKFEGTQWLLIQKAEEEKLLQVKVKLPEDKEKDLLFYAEMFYLNDNVCKISQLWNEQRRMILEDSFFTYILPSMEKEVRSLLTARSKDWLRMEYGKKLWDKVSVAPYDQWKENGIENDYEEETGLKVLACCWGSGKPATTFVMLDSSGGYVEDLCAGSISARSQALAEQQRKQNDQQRVLKFIADHQPQVVCVGAANLFCRQLKYDIYEIFFKIVEDHPREISQDIYVTIVDESLPRLYESSLVSLDQCPNRPGIVRRAIALGRYFQNPLAMVATLCGPGKEILSWKLCPQEHFLSPDEKYEVVEQIMVDATNQVGLDVNLAANHEWLFAPLQFISGLGPRKAASLQKAFVGAGSISNRKEITMGKIIRKKVFMNAAGFLRVRRSGIATDSSHIMDLLDDTRIHPESYALAKSLAKDVYVELEPHEPSEMNDDEQMAIEHARDRPNMCKALDIDEYAKSYYHRFEINKRETLYDIKMELLHGFKDWRFPFRDLNPDEEFSLLSGETDETISDGRIVQVAVCNIQENRIICAFDSGLKALVMADDFSDDGYDPERIQLRVGDILTGKIKNVSKERFKVYLTCKASELYRISHDNQNYDTYYREPKNRGEENVPKEKELAKKHNHLRWTSRWTSPSPSPEASMPAGPICTPPPASGPPA